MSLRIRICPPMLFHENPLNLESLGIVFNVKALEPLTHAPPSHTHTVSLGCQQAQTQSEWMWLERWLGSGLCCQCPPNLSIFQLKSPLLGKNNTQILGLGKLTVHDLRKLLRFDKSLLTKSKSILNPGGPPPHPDSLKKPPHTSTSLLQKWFHHWKWKLISHASFSLFKNFNIHEYFKTKLTKNQDENQDENHIFFLKNKVKSKMIFFKLSC